MNTNQIFESVDNRTSMLEDINAYIWDNPELGFMETKSIVPLIEALKKEGFSIEEKVAGIPTAFVGTWGSGRPIIGLLAEFDALPVLSQKASCATKEEVEKGGNGHGCGHCAIATGTLGAALAIKDYLERNKLSGTVKYYGCPGEEYGSGKAFMARDGVFDDDDCCLTWHPNDFNAMMSFGTLSNKRYQFQFKGRAAHAASVPHLGRSALDACELMNVGVNYMREHMIPEARIHYAYVNAGGPAANIVHDFAELSYTVRSPKMKETLELAERVKKVAKGAALMTETELTIIEKEGMSDTMPMESLDKLMYESLVEVGPPQYDEEDYKLAQLFREDMSEDEKLGNYVRMTSFLGINNKEEAIEISKKGLPDSYPPFNYNPDYYLMGSTDVGDVSYVVPTTGFMLASWAIGVLAHSWKATALSNSSINTKAIVCAAKAMALTAIKVYENPKLAEEMKAEHKRRIPDGYVCPISKDFKPYDAREF
ncbi:hypothetical protein AN396_01600 [Candidatus Epulonipiscium fishelsonii]|uniref:Uncharacterized protein n=1 Tax=Candidatus Epulonipiscium fishelsonii TaxID=77094 RepID=A0ACC8XHD7_9FIRM|nr:hypothetical protein AN396_01600 [Epulopiscium sp. SCG-B11WGA-EpuloA1]